MKRGFSLRIKSLLFHIIRVQIRAYLFFLQHWSNRPQKVKKMIWIQNYLLSHIAGCINTYFTYFWWQDLKRKGHDLKKGNDTEKLVKWSNVSLLSGASWDKRHGVRWKQQPYRQSWDLSVWGQPRCDLRWERAAGASVHCSKHVVVIFPGSFLFTL